MEDKTNLQRAAEGKNVPPDNSGGLINDSTATFSGESVESTPVIAARPLKPLKGITKKSYRVKGTLRQQRAIKNLIESHGTLGRAMLAAGYDETTTLKPQNLTESKAYKQALPDIIKSLEVERQRAIEHMKGKIGKAKYRDMVEAADKLTKNIQLLSGGATVKGDITFSWDKD